MWAQNRITSERRLERILHNWTRTVLSAPYRHDHENYIEFQQRLRILNMFTYGERCRISSSISKTDDSQAFQFCFSIYHFIYSKCLQQVIGAILVLRLEFEFAAHVIGQRYNTRTWHLSRNHADARSFAERSEIGRIVLFLGQQFFFSHLCAAKQTVKIIHQMHGQNQHFTYAVFPITFMQCSRISSFDLPSMSMINSLPFSNVRNERKRHEIEIRIAHNSCWICWIELKDSHRKSIEWMAMVSDFSL